jgi:hypothetical protein
MLDVTTYTIRHSNQFIVEVVSIHQRRIYHFYL